MIATYTDRRFQLWEYRVSHGSLLIRSPKGLKVPRNIDLAFVGVDFVAVPHVLNGLAIDQAMPDDVDLVRKIFGEVKLSNFYVLISQGRRYMVVAAGLHIDENEADIFDSPF